MKKALFLILFTFSCLKLYSQDEYVIMRLDNNKNININDITYTRILNGIVVNNNEKVAGFEGVKIVSKENSKKFGFSGTKSVMIISQEVPLIESQIDSVLYSRGDFLESYQYPLDFRLPISIGNKLISNKEKNTLFSKFKLGDIVKIEYLDNKNPKVNPSQTPFGVINLKIK